jgi:hypothetical protein
MRRLIEIAGALLELAHLRACRRCRAVSAAATGMRV